MDKSIELPIEECGLTVSVGTDGVWLHFKTTIGKSESIHVHNCLGEEGSFTVGAINAWCVEIQNKARALPQGGE